MTVCRNGKKRKPWTWPESQRRLQHKSFWKRERHKRF
jgi:hypothetical protein